jgi:hypothetical protein
MRPGGMSRSFNLGFVLPGRSPFLEEKRKGTGIYMCAYMRGCLVEYRRELRVL